MTTPTTPTATVTNFYESYEPTIRTSNTVTNEIDPNQLLAKKSFALIFAVAVACIGSSFIFGYTIGVTNVPEKEIIKWIEISHYDLFGTKYNELIWSSAVSAFAVGGMIGSMISGILADKIGRKKTLHVNNIFAIVGSGLMFGAPYTKYYMLFHLGRLIIGFNVGIGSSIVPMFITELAPVKWRGALGTLPQLMVTISILIAQIMGLAFKKPDLWPIIFALPLIPAIFQVTALFFVIESPKYTLTVKKDAKQALKDLASLRDAPEDHPLVQQELQLISKETQAYENEPKVGIINLFSGKLLWPTFLACFLQAAQQLSGINAAMFYSSQIFREAHLSEDNSIYATLGMGSANVATTIVSFFLVEALGRRTLLLIGKIGMLISTIMLVVAIHQQWSWVPIGLVVIFVISFATGPGSIPFFYVSEVFGSNARASASALATATNWTCNFIIGLGFPPIQKLIGEYVFLIFSGCLIVAIVVIIMWLPETKGKSVEEVQENMEKRKTKCCC